MIHISNPPEPRLLKRLLKLHTYVVEIDSSNLVTQLSRFKPSMMHMWLIKRLSFRLCALGQILQTGRFELRLDG